MDHMILTGTAFRATGLTFKFFALSLTVAVFFFLSFSSFLFISSDDTSDHRLYRRLILALKSDPLKPRLDQIKEQADDHHALALAYASHARKVKLENSKLGRVFAELSGNLTYLVTKPPYSGCLSQMPSPLMIGA